MRKEIEKWYKRPRLNKKELWVLRFSPRAIVCGLQCSGLSLKEQLRILAAILKKYGRSMDILKQDYLRNQVEALGEHCR